MTSTLGHATDLLLSTTRAVRRRLDFDRPVPREIIRDCLRLAVQAPSASNIRLSHFLVVDDQSRRSALAELYRRSFEFYRDDLAAAGNVVTGDPAGDAAQQRVMASAEYLAANLHRVPAMVIPCLSGWSDSVTSRWNEATFLASVIPAAWSFCLAARSRGLGTAWTTLHLRFEQEAAGILGIPFETMRQIALIPVAYSTGTDFQPAWRAPLESFVTFR
jgi:nitroreductase